MKQITRAAVLSLAVAGILSASFNLRTVSASETSKKATAQVNGVIPPGCEPTDKNGCGIFR